MKYILLSTIVAVSFSTHGKELACQAEINQVLTKIGRPLIDGTRYKFSRLSDDSAYSYNGLIESFDKSKKSYSDKLKKYKNECEDYLAKAEKDLQKKTIDLPVIQQPKKITYDAKRYNPLTQKLEKFRNAKYACSDRRFDPCTIDLMRYLRDQEQLTMEEMKEKSIPIPDNLVPGDDGGLLNVDKYHDDKMRKLSECEAEKLDLEQIKSDNMAFIGCATNGRNISCTGYEEELKFLQLQYNQLSNEVKILKELVPEEKQKAFLKFDEKKLADLKEKIEQLKQDKPDLVIEFDEKLAVRDISYKYRVHVSSKEDAPLPYLFVNKENCKIALPEFTNCETLAKSKTYAYGLCPQDEKHPSHKTTNTPATGRR